MHFFKVVSIVLVLFSVEGLCAEVEAIVPSMVTISAGKFIMGSNDKGGIKVFHSPAHEVSVKSFQISKYELTVKEFRRFVEAVGYKTKDECWRRKVGENGIEMVAGRWDSAAYAPTESHPVMCVGMDDALAYIEWLSSISGKKYRLPSEAEWEYAARANSKDDYFFGNDETKLCEYANVLDKAGAAAFLRDLDVELEGVDCHDGVEYISPVGMYKPNGFGLFDMIGNVGELVADCQHLYYKNAPSDGSVWSTECDDNKSLFGLIRVPMFIHRGGNYGLSGAASRIFERGHTGFANASSLGEGFRLALDADFRLSQSD